MDSAYGEPLDNLTDQQVTYMILATFMRDKENAEKTSTVLIHRFGDLKRILSADMSELISGNCMKRSDAERLLVYSAFFKYVHILQHPMPRTINETDAFYDYLKALYYNEVKEKVYVITLDSRQKILNSYMLSEGDQTSVSINKDSLIKVIRSDNKCRNIILVHNHPDGNIEASTQDITYTSIISKIAAGENVKLLGHYIVAGDDIQEITSQPGIIAKLFGL